MIYQVSHETTYHYRDDVSISHNLVHLTARACARQTLLSNELTVSVPPAVTTVGVDYYGNPFTSFTIQEPHKRLSVRALNLVRVHPTSRPIIAESVPWEQVRDLARTDHSPATLDAYQFTFDSPYVKLDPCLYEYALPSFPAGRPVLEAALDLTHRIYTEFAFDSTATTIATPVTEVLRLKRGVCQDFAHFQIGCLRSLGLPARYVSGYLQTLPPPGQARLIGADASHAWLSAYCPRFGWLDVDPTNDVIPGAKHILVAWGRDYDDVSPVRGVILGGGRHSLRVAVDVVRVDEDSPIAATEGVMAVRPDACIPRRSSVIPPSVRQPP